MVPPEPDPPVQRPRRAAPRWWVSLIVAGLLAAFLVGAAFLPVPYVAMRPGTTRPVTEHVRVVGAESHPPEQSIAFTTVRVGTASLLEAFVGWLDDDVDIRPEDAVRGDRSEEENRRYNAQLMDVSKMSAITVALRHLGHDVPIRTTGTVVRELAEGAPAEDLLQVDDVVVAVDGEAVNEPGELGDLLQDGGPGATHVLTVERPPGSTETLDVPIETISADDDPSRAIIGVVGEDRIADFEFPFEVFIDSGEVGGPSAGLAFALAVIDMLTPGELTGGQRVAVTGTIALDGTVGPVGGTAQKAVTVRDAGYDVFLVPIAEVDEVRASAGSGLQVIGVGTLAEALQALESLGGSVGAPTTSAGTGGSP